MHEVDLIPESYRLARQRGKWLVATLLAAAGLVAITAALRVGLVMATDEAKEDLARLQQQKAVSQAQRDELQRLLDEQADLQRQLYLLAGLRSGTEAQQFFRMIDGVIVENEVWFLDWRFSRAGVSNGTQQASVETGYFIVVSDNPGAAPGHAWHVQTHMEIAGQSKDHAALSRFVKRLFARPEIADVRVRRTELQRYRSRTVVDFDLAITINTSIETVTT